MGGVPLLLDFPGKEIPHKECLGWDPSWGIFGVFLYVYVLFQILRLKSYGLKDALRTLGSMQCVRDTKKTTLKVSIIPISVTAFLELSMSLVLAR